MEVKPGYKQTEVGVIPEDWHIDSLSSVTPRNRPNGIVDGPFGSNLKTIHYRKSGIPIITSGYVTEGRFAADSYLYVDKAKFDEEKRSAVRSGDIVMAKIGARCGASAILPDWHQIGILSGNALKITVDESRHSTFYVWQLLWNLYSWGRVEPLRTVGAQPAISMANLKKYKLPLPPLPEQRIIATSLSNVDTLLNAVDRLIAKKRGLKLAAMQQLLTGQTRLPGFTGEWGAKPLGSEIADLEAGVSVNSVEDDLENGSSHLAILKTSAVANGRFIPSECKTIASRDLWRVKLSPRAESVIISRMNTIDLVGECGYVPTNFPKLFVPDRLWMTRFKTNSRVSAKWLAYVLSSPGSRRLLRNIATGTSGSMKNIAKGKFLALEFAFPPPDEQTAIAAVLTDMDAELAALEQWLAKTRGLKQGMMQELLTGKTRLVSPEASHA